MLILIGGVVASVVGVGSEPSVQMSMSEDADAASAHEESLLANEVPIGHGDTAADASFQAKSPTGSGQSELVCDGLSVKYHPMTQEDADFFKEFIGVRQSATDYNVIIDGHGTGLAPPTEEEWNEGVGSLKVVDSVSSAGSAPGATSDISSEPYFPAVGNQGSQGSCAAWAMTYYAYGYLESKDNLWTDASSGNPDHLMSPAWTFNKANGGGDGSWMSDNGRIIQDWGTATLAAMPYYDSDSYSWGSQEAWRMAPLHRASEVYLLDYSGEGTVTSVKNLLSNQVPVTFALDAYEFGPSFSDGNKVMSAAEYSSYNLNHAQTFVGYDDAVSDDGEIGAFKVVNSWGTHDGYTDHGYYWMTYECFKEIGSMLFLTYIADVPSYVPSMLSVWHFNSAPSRNADIQVGIGSHSSPFDSKSPYYEPDSDVSLPTFMCLDISEFEEEYDSGTEDFYLEIGDSSTTGTISSFRTEHYEGSYVPGSADQASPQSPDVPSSSPSYVTNDFRYYSPMPMSSGLDNATLVFDGAGVADWVCVDHHSYQDGDAAQSGDVGDSGYTSLFTSVEGPVNLTFYWRVSSQAGKDFLRFYVDSVEVESISGEIDWQWVSRTLYAGTHAIAWQYSKDGSTSSGDDCGWVDMLGSHEAQPDESPPTTSAQLSGILSSSGWYRSVCTITLSANDGYGSGVRCTNYSIDGGPWSRYVEPIVVSANGEHRIEYYSVDHYGNTETTKSEEFRIDTVDPSTRCDLTGTAGANDWYVSDVEAYLTATDGRSGVQYIRYRIDGGSWRTYDGPVVLTLDGEFILEYYSIDVAGNYENVQLSIVRIDRAAPETTPMLEGDVGQAEWFVSTVSVALSSSDALSGIDSTRFRVDKGIWTDYSIGFDIEETGRHTLEYYSLDVAGNNEIIKSVQISIDDIVPQTSIHLSGLQGSGEWYRSSVDVNLTVADAHSGPDLTRYSVDGGAWLNFTASFSVTEEGEHSIEYCSVDAAGNLESVKSMAVKIDTVPPNTSADLSGTEGSNGWFKSGVTVDLLISDAGSGVSSTMYRVDGSEWQEYESPFEVSENGAHHIDFYSADISGNNQAQVTLNLNIDDMPPELAIEGDGGPVSATTHDVPIAWSSSDSTSSLAMIEIKIDNGDFVVYPGSQSAITLEDLADGEHVVVIRAIDVAGNFAEQTVTIDVNTNPFDPEGPMGPWAIVGLAALLFVIVAAAVVWSLAKKGKGRH